MTINEALDHIQICADAWERSGVSRVRTIIKTAEKIRKALTEEEKERDATEEV